ncbi:MAG: hypothetical protein UT42_C0034G0003 [Candidatus Falkowbacteria bacterium GW2011_GWA2_39_24]|uniref:DUF2238 domain-containing protein n=1 Tax=Candidatus Falkowbacteria bacterium GW2011_GWA2_39_24 TaxID=1618634 RepID=A0A0G0RK79_9BACT|nr:MAG: hypothetical protein UT42_C0034G0003 [Candidatus Falkowbacteria bacterium GW2011_GWA2_39_24]
MKLARLLILGLIAFEFLNLIEVLHFTLDFSWLGLMITSLGVFIIVETVYYGCCKKDYQPPIFPYYLVAIALYFDALGDIAHFYANYTWYDQVAHALGGAVVMSMVLGIFWQLKKKYLLPLMMILMIGLASTSLMGSLYEIEEYLEDKYYHHRQLRLGDGPDTVNDILCNLSGGFAVGVLYYLKQKNLEKRPY